ncbi:hypothetical protein GW922_03440, partial [Candidatus Pacearchaeota archaeon]|nr:hypothetical protein [Candidatus Pacearchaeota archaeon]
TNSSNDSLATLNLAKYYANSSINVGLNTSSAVYFHVPVNDSLAPSEDSFNIFNLPNKIYSIEIIPARFQKDGNTPRFVSCGSAKIREVLTCS